MCASGRSAEVEFGHEQTSAKIQCGSRNRRTGGNRRRARRGSHGGDCVRGSGRGHSVGSSSERVEERSALPIEVEPPAQQQLAEAHEWWEINRTAAPNAIRQDFESMVRLLARTPNIGRRATDTVKRNVRKMFLRRVGFVIYYRVIGSPPRLQILAFWHARRGKGPPI